MRIVMLSVNHHTAPVELREKLALRESDLSGALVQLRQRYPQAEFVAISTCNRTEVYVARPSHTPPSVDELRGFLSALCRVEAELLSAISAHHEDDAAVGHLFRLASGLESMVLGETQILGQVKRAYELAMRAESIGPALHLVFQQAIAAAKQIRSQTGIDQGRISVGSVAVDFARQIFDHFNDKIIVGIGAGEMAKVTLLRLLELNPRKLWITNRSLDRAITLATELSLTADRGGARAFEELDQLLIEADIIVTSTGSMQPIITAERFKPLMKHRRGRPLFLIDIAVPRDVDAQVDQLRDVYLYNIDDLQAVVEKTFGQRGEQIAQCNVLIDDAVASCMSHLQHRDIGQLIRALREQLHELGRIEQQRTSRKLAAARPDEVPAIVEEHTHRLINKILHLPLSQLDRRKHDAPLAFYAAALRRLFGLDRRENEPEAHRSSDDTVSTGEMDAETPDASGDINHDHRVTAGGD